VSFAEAEQEEQGVLTPKNYPRFMDPRGATILLVEFGGASQVMPGIIELAGRHGCYRSPLSCDLTPENFPAVRTWLRRPGNSGAEVAVRLLVLQHRGAGGSKRPLENDHETLGRSRQLIGELVAEAARQVGTGSDIEFPESTTRVTAAFVICPASQHSIRTKVRRAMMEEGAQPLRLDQFLERQFRYLTSNPILSYLGHWA